MKLTVTHLAVFAALCAFSSVPVLRAQTIDEASAQRCATLTARNFADLPEAPTRISQSTSVAAKDS
ncbi:MAG TPA: hypothetical protein VGD54_10040, partial [Steroidobacteraceae bacterium]